MDNEKITVYGTKIGIRSLARATDNRMIVGGVIPDLPAGHSVNYLTPKSAHLRQPWFVILSSLAFDWQARMRIAGTNMTLNFFEEISVPLPRKSSLICPSSQPSLGLALVPQAVARVEWSASEIPLSDSERLRCNSIADALVASVFGLDADDLSHILQRCDLVEPRGQPTGFWRVDKEKDPELRHTILTQFAFRDLQRSINRVGDWQAGVRQFLDQNRGDGWLMPETLRLADHGLGEDERAAQPQLVACRLGPRFLDWQLAQSADESEREYHLHARNLLGVEGYARLLVAFIQGRAVGGEDRLDLLIDWSKRRLLADEGQVTVLVEVRAARLVDDDTFWTAAAELRDGVNPGTDRYGKLLDQLHARGFLDNIGYRLRSGRNPPAPDDTAQLRVAESGTSYQAAAPGAGEQEELFE